MGRLLTIGADYFVQRTMLDDDSGCLIWLRACDAAGYARMTPRATGERFAHRNAYIVFVGDIPAGHEVDHLCFNRSCVNPLHLEAVTPTENKQRTAGRKTHCPRGHAYDEANTYRAPGTNSRSCRICSSDRARAFNERGFMWPRR